MMVVLYCDLSRGELLLPTPLRPQVAHVAAWAWKSARHMQATCGPRGLHCASTDQKALTGNCAPVVNQQDLQGRAILRRLCGAGRQAGAKRCHTTCLELARRDNHLNCMQ
jgi:hypothetical protein